MADLLEWTYAYRKLMVVDTACELDLFTLLAQRPRTADELAEGSGSQPRPLRALLDACVGLELLGLERGRYANRAVAERYLVRGRPLFLGDLFRVFAAEARQWLSLDELVRTGGSAGHGPVDIGPRRFTMAMHALGMLGEAAALARAVDLSGRRDLLDVGCGSGIYSVQLCRRNPQLSATLLDRPAVLEVAQEIVAAEGLSERFTLTPGDMLKDSYGRGRDVVLLSDVLYQKTADSLVMLRSAYEALAPNGLLVVRGYLSDPESDPNPFGALFDLARLFWGDDRETMPLPRVLQWLEKTGFTDLRAFRITERSTCITAGR